MRESRCTIVGALVVALVLPVVPATSQPTPEIPQRPPMIHGAPVQILDQRPALRTLFELDTASESPRIEDDAEIRDGQVLARFPLEMTDDDVQRVALQVGASRAVRQSPFGLFVLFGPENRWDTETMMRRLWATRKAVRISPVYVGTEGGIAFSPNDPHATSGAQWYLDQPSGIDLDLPTAWDITRGSSSVVVAVMDTGIKTSHPELAGRLWTNPGEIPGNFVDDDINGYVDDVYGWDTTNVQIGGDPFIEDDDGGQTGHGTFVSSILMANTHNSHQVAGFDHHAKLLTVRSLNQTSAWDNVSLIKGTDYLLATAAHWDVANMSFSVQAVGALTDLAINLDIMYAENRVIIAGSGNTFHGNLSSRLPGGHRATLAVGATDDTDLRADFSTYGTGMDFMAPGVDIYTASFTDPSGTFAFHQEDGTSFSSPMVAGIASLGVALRPLLRRDELVFALRESAIDLGPPGYDTEYGWGRVNAPVALESLLRVIFFDDFETENVSRWTSSVP